MEALIISLIVVVLAQTCIYIYGQFIDIKRQHQLNAALQIQKDSLRSYVDANESLQKAVDNRDETIKRWVENYNNLSVELDEARKVNGLLKNRTAYIEGLKDSFNGQMEGQWNMWSLHNDTDEMSKDRCYVEGAKAAAEWVCRCVGVKAEFEIDGRWNEETEEDDVKDEDE